MGARFSAGLEAAVNTLTSLSRSIHSSLKLLSREIVRAEFPSLFRRSTEETGSGNGWCNERTACPSCLVLAAPNRFDDRFQMIRAAPAAGALRTLHCDCDSSRCSLDGVFAIFLVLVSHFPG